MIIFGIDPGVSGAISILENKKVIEVYPKISSKLSRKKDSNKADAILIARYFNDTQL